MKNLLSTLVLCLGHSLGVFAQNDAYWSKSEETAIEVTGTRQIIPGKYKTFKIVPNDLKAKLFSAPHERAISISQSPCIISLPMPNGSFERFRVVNSPIMQEELAQSFPDMKTFSIRGIDDVHASGKLDWNEFGFHGMVLSPNGNYFIDPYCVGNVSDYIAYYTADFKKPVADIIPEVGVIHSESNDQRKPLPGSGEIAAKVAASPCVGAQLHTYRLAVGCTGQYAKAATGLPAPTIAQTLAKVVTSVNRVDGVYESEVSVRLILVSTTTLTLYGITNTSTVIAAAPSATAQPYFGNNNAGTLINESQTIINSLVGSSNYDIGHTFSTGGGGLANFGCVCSNTDKARGITGSANPVGDPYDIDYVAHEVGHQFGGDHTFNCGTGSCAGNRNTATSMEPGSGVTMMAYAGICGQTDNIELNSIPYFHGVSYDQIANFTNTGGGSNCDVIINTGNQPPVVTGSANYIVPKSTPFYLTGSAIDPDGDALTYSWEEMDAGSGAAASWNSGSKPYFRSYTPTTTATRYFPIASVAANGNFTGVKGEYVPPTAQVLNFRLTARDNKTTGGGVCYAATTVTIDASGPLMVTYPNLPGIVWGMSTQKVVSWDVNGTDAAPVSCDSVRILLSYNSGSTFTTLVASTPNDGSELITVPAVASSINTCRIKIESKGNVFYDIGNNNFTISTDDDVSLAKISGGSQLGLHVWPNPFNTAINLLVNNLNNREETRLTVIDVLGKTVLQTNYSNRSELNESLDMSSLSKGVYFVRLVNGNKQSVYRIVKD